MMLLGRVNGGNPVTLHRFENKAKNFSFIVNVQKEKEERI
jgi:hypothetical protein